MGFRQEIRSRVLIAFALAIYLAMGSGSASLFGQVDEKDEHAGVKRPEFFDKPLDFSKPPKLPEITPPTEAEIQKSIDRGVKFLLKTQNPDGSWGTHADSRPFQIFAPIPGAHHAFRAATTSMCVSALLETESTDSEVVMAIDQAEVWLTKKLPRLKRATGDAIYNVWGHAYAIQALVRLHQRKGLKDEHRERLAGLIRGQLEMLDRYESVDGGWGYYDFRAQARKPTGSSISFVNSTVLIAMKEAQNIGIEPTAKVVKRAIAATKRQQKPDFTYLYGEYLDKRPMRDINRPGGSLGRSQCCNAALRMWGAEDITDNVLKTWLVRLYVRNGWLSIGRKRPVPHEAWFAVAGYFYYYGHYYAAYCVEILKEEERQPYREMLAKIILRHQEPNGCWWDYTLYGYHQQYGTAFAIMTLQRCLPTKAE